MEEDPRDVQSYKRKKRSEGGERDRERDGMPQE
jgi:hypothetical protein